MEVVYRIAASIHDTKFTILFLYKASNHSNEGPRCTYDS